MRQQLFFAGLVACTILMASCESGVPTAPHNGSVEVVVAFDRNAAAPGDTVHATITATPTGGARVESVRLTARGLLERADTLALTAASRGSQTATHSYVLPSNTVGTLRLTAVASGTGRMGMAEASLESADTTPPQIGIAQLSRSVRRDTVRLVLATSDNAGIAAVVVRLSGAFALVDSATLGYPRHTLDSLWYLVPAGADLTRPLEVRVEVWDVGGQRAHAQLAPILLRDPRRPAGPPPVDYAPPLVSSALIAPGGMPAVHFSAASYVPGERVMVRLEAIDDVRLALMGYRIGAPVNVADSVAVDAPNAVALRTFTLLPSWLGVAPVTFFAVDEAGRRTEVDVGPMSVYAVATRAMRGVEVPGNAFSGSDLGIAVSDAVFDAKRHVLYLAQPDSDRVLVLSTRTMTFDAPIVVPRAPMGVDLTPSGDSLVIALRRTHAIAVVDLLSTTRQPDTLRIEVPYSMAPSGPGPTSQGPGQVRITSRGEAFIRFNFDGTGFNPLWLYDIAARRQRHRTDGGFNGYISHSSTLAPSGDRTRVLLFADCLICTANVGQIYDAVSDTFGPRVYTTQTHGASVSLDRSGERVLIASSLFDRNLDFLRTFAPPGFDLGFKRMHSTTPTAIAPSGDLVYVSIKDGAYYLVRTADGGVLEKVLLPATTKRLLLIEEGRVLVSIGLTSGGRTRVDLVDLR